MASRRGFLGAVFAGGAAVAAKSVSAYGDMTTVEREFIVPKDVAAELESAKNDHAVMLDLRSDTEAQTLVSKMVSVQPSHWLWGDHGMKLNAGEYSSFVKEHLEVNKKYGVTPRQYFGTNYGPGYNQIIDG
jgi:hypothetical protein